MCQNAKDLYVSFTIKSVESVPCSLNGQKMDFDKSGNLISDPIKTPWPMEWVLEEVKKYAIDIDSIQDESNLKIDNPNEPDQYIKVKVNKYR